MGVGVSSPVELVFYSFDVVHERLCQMLAIPLGLLYLKSVAHRALDCMFLAAETRQPVL
jgi:hypothetical protein